MATKTSIKGTRQKNSSGSYSNFIPFGTDGEYVDMLDGLSLERQLKLGGPCVTSFQQNNNGYIITEKYGNASATTDYYEVVTTVTDTNDGSISKLVCILYWIDSSGRHKKKTKTIQVNGQYTLLTDAGIEITTDKGISIAAEKENQDNIVEVLS